MACERGQSARHVVKPWVIGIVGLRGGFNGPLSWLVLSAKLPGTIAARVWGSLMERGR